MKRAAVLQSLLAVSTLVLLSSVGGAGAIAAPLLLPLHFLAARSSHVTAIKVLWALLGAATAAEAIWVVTYSALDESQPFIWLFPSLAAIVAGAVILLGTRKSFAAAAAKSSNRSWHSSGGSAGR
jgi:hypothetical protein